MYRRGVVAEVDAKKHLVRVTWPAKGDLLSPWLDVPVPDTLDDKVFSMPAKGSQVACIMGENDDEGCVIGSVYSQTDPPSEPQSEDVRRITFKDGATIEYDREAHKLTIDIPSGGELSITVSGDVKVDATGDVEITPGGLLKVAGADEFVALADKTEARLQALESIFNAHSHGTGVGPSTPPIGPIVPGDPVHSTKTKSS